MPFITTNGIRLYYEERGAGEPLLLIMGITAPGAVWEKHAEDWQGHFRCIIGDNRGVGQSDKPVGPYSTEQMADDYAGLIDSLGLTNVRVVGVSMGSTIAQQLALRHPDKVRSLVLMCPWARCDRTAEAIFRHMATIKARLRPEEFANYIQLLIYSKKSWDDDTIFADLQAGRLAAASDANPQPLHGLEGQAEACIAHDTLADLPQIAQPTLVIGGRNDQFTPVWMSEEVAAAIPHSELHLYDEAGHAFHWECIDDFNPRVRDWLRAH
ncbi:alpha/beta fold hydrolase [Fibrella aquatica]|uniref:alpha/beta fold hydrolase n=1 Tax=Fibrella aquatica TaxID=3242487 RepID=UPI0035209610